MIDPQAAIRERPHDNDFFNKHAGLYFFKHFDAP